MNQMTPLPEAQLAGYRATGVTEDQMPDVVSGLFGRLLSSMQQLGLDPDQPTYAWYDGAAGPITIGVGLPADQVPDGASHDFEITTLAAADQGIAARHTGGLDGIGPAWRELHQQIAQRGLHPAGPAREVYLEGSMDRPDSWVIELQQPVAGADRG